MNEFIQAHAQKYQRQVKASKSKQARARAEAQAVSDFLQKGVLGSLNVYSVKGEEITVRSVLDAASEKLDEELVDQPLVQASIRWTLASAYGVLGLFEPAELHAKRAFEIRRTQLGAVPGKNHRAGPS